LQDTGEGKNTAAGAGTKGATDGISFSIDLETGQAAAMEEISLAALGLREREDLQRWVAEHPEIISDGLLLVTTEFDRWEIRDQKVWDRLDVLLLDADGSPVVAELKRDRAADTVELQALKYAAYCSQLTLDDLAEEYARHHDEELDDARARLIDHAPSIEDRGPGKIRIRLLAGEFGPAVTSVVLWLSEYGIDIGCIEVRARRANGKQAILSARQLLPLPEAEDYLVRRRRKELEEEETRERAADWTWDMYKETLSAGHLAVAREVFRRMERYVADKELLWKPVFREGWLGFQRPGGYYVPVLQLYREKPISFGIKIQDNPAKLGLADPYPNLESYWDDHNRQWNWRVPTIDQVPDVSAALDLALPYQPERGPMSPRLP
jgi:hypothetical protein